MYIHPLYHWPPKSIWRDAATDGAFEWSDFGAYIHFPFCRNICSFCNYETRLIDKKSATAWASSVHREIDEYLDQGDISSACVRSLFFGGGTASLVPIDVVSSLVSRMAAVNGSQAIAEVTLECEPGTIDRARLKAARDAGVNRLGVCAQSFDDEMLHRLTRQHTSADVYKLIESALDVGFENIHLDLMYGLPGQDAAHWERTLETALGLPFTHISAYKFYVFRHGQIDREGVAPRAAGETDIETSRLADMHNLTIETLASGGFDQYSLTEYAKPGFICDYLARTFGGGDILPIGPSAFGRRGTHVWQNSGLVHLQGDAEAWKRARATYRMTRSEAFKRDVILGLWLLRVDLSDLELRYDVVSSTALKDLLSNLSSAGLLTWHGGQILLEPGQRFWVGDAMQRLADLDTVDWVAGDVAPSSRDTSAPLSEGVRSIFRVARRDPAFYLSLSSDPKSTLDGLQHALTPQETDSLVCAIVTTDTHEQDDDDPFLRAWRATQRELGRPRRQRQ